MITWMQRHKKWLITTIWVSTIAFVGAGFVGWGSYDFGKSQGAVAIVGDKEVKFSALQNEYNNVYNQYAKMFGNQFNQEMAEKFKLQDVALNSIIQKYLLLNYADELGLDATKKDIAKELVSMSAFIVNGKFDKETYIKVLSQNRTTPAEFEQRVKEDIILRKVQDLFLIPTDKKELENLSKLFMIEDELKIKIIDGNTLHPQITDDKIKAFWEKNKQKYMSEPSYEIKTYTTPIDNTPQHSDEDIKAYYDTNKFDYTKEDGKLQTLQEAKDKINFDLNAKASKKVALKAYLKLKKDALEFTDTKTLFETKFPYKKENIQNIKDAKEGTVLKPFIYDGKFIVIKLVKKIQPQPLSFDDAKELVKIDLEKTLQATALEDAANKELKNFTGTNVGFISSKSADKLEGLDLAQAQEFLAKLFTTNKKNGIVMLNNKAVVYEILQSRLGDNLLAKENSIKDSIQNLKNNEIMKNLIEKLRMQYEVYSYKDQGK